MSPRCRRPGCPALQKRATAWWRRAHESRGLIILRTKCGRATGETSRRPRRLSTAGEELASGHTARLERAPRRGGGVQRHRRGPLAHHAAAAQSANDRRRRRPRGARGRSASCREDRAGPRCTSGSSGGAIAEGAALPSAAPRERRSAEIRELARRRPTRADDVATAPRRHPCGTMSRRVRQRRAVGGFAATGALLDGSSSATLVERRSRVSSVASSSIPSPLRRAAVRRRTGTRRRRHTRTRANVAARRFGGAHAIASGGASREERPRQREAGARVACARLRRASEADAPVYARVAAPSSSSVPRGVATLVARLVVPANFGPSARRMAAPTFLEGRHRGGVPRAHQRLCDSTSSFLSSSNASSCSFDDRGDGRFRRGVHGRIRALVGASAPSARARASPPRRRRRRASCARARRLLTDAAREVGVAFGGLTALALDGQRVREMDSRRRVASSASAPRRAPRPRGAFAAPLDARLRGALAPSERDVLAFQLLDTLAHDFHERRFLEIGRRRDAERRPNGSRPPTAAVTARRAVLRRGGPPQDELKRAECARASRRTPESGRRAPRGGLDDVLRARGGARRLGPRFPRRQQVRVRQSEFGSREKSRRRATTVEKHAVANELLRREDRDAARSNHPDKPPRVSRTEFRTNPPRAPSLGAFIARAVSPLKSPGSSSNGRYVIFLTTIATSTSRCDHLGFPTSRPPQGRGSR